MPVVGNRKSTAGLAQGYSKDPIHKLAAAFQECVKDILSESGVDTFSEPSKALMMGAPRQALKNFFVEGQADCREAEARALGDDALAASEDAIEEAEALFDNNCEQILEYANLGAYNPVIGMTFPIHKNILMNNIFDKGAIPKVVAKEPKFTISLETRTLITPDGQEIDMYKEQYKMRDAIDATAPFKEVEISLPEMEATDVLTAIGGSGDENLSIETYVSAVHMSIYLAAGDINPETNEEVEEDGEVAVWIPTHLDFTSAYGEYDRTIMQGVEVTGRDADNPTETKVYKDVISGYMKKNKFGLASLHGIVDAIKLNARFDTSTAMFKTCSVTWSVRTDLVEIPSANPINVPVSPEEVKDVGALYNINQLSKILSLIRLALANYKDDKIKQKLDESFIHMPDDSKYATTFDFAPRASYALDHVEWRHKTFMDFLDSVVSGLMQVLNDPNMTVSIFGAPELVRKITPTEYTYVTPSNVGPVDLDFTKTVCTSDKRVYQFISSDKLRGNSNLIIILCPRNSERIIYRIYDYQMYISNEIRNMNNPALPAIHAFERWKFVEYQPVQARLKILNPTGLTNIAPNDDPIGTSGYSDFNLLK
jgi:hypothetical protein